MARWQTSRGVPRSRREAPRSRREAPRSSREAPRASREAPRKSRPALWSWRCRALQGGGASPSGAVLPSGAVGLAILEVTRHALLELLRCRPASGSSPSPFSARTPGGGARPRPSTLSPTPWWRFPQPACSGRSFAAGKGGTWRCRRGHGEGAGRVEARLIDAQRTRRGRCSCWRGSPSSRSSWSAPASRCSDLPTVGARRRSRRSRTSRMRRFGSTRLGLACSGSGSQVGSRSCAEG